VALNWGLVNRVVADEELADEAVGWAAGIAANAPLSLEGNKGALRALLAAEGALDPEVERELVALREACFRSEDFREGVRAFGEKRAPEWKGR
jgi:enoyl-CoA hydratase/carnithine racemase